MFDILKCCICHTVGESGLPCATGSVFQVRVFNELVLYNYKFRLKTFHILNETTINQKSYQNDVTFLFYR